MILEDFESKIECEKFTELYKLLDEGQFEKAKKTELDLDTLIFVEDDTVYFGKEFTGYPLIYYYIILGKIKIVGLLIDMGAKPDLKFYGGQKRPLDGIKYLDTENKINMFFFYLQKVLKNNSWNSVKINKKHLKELRLCKIKHVDNYEDFILLNNEFYTFIK